MKRYLKENKKAFIFLVVGLLLGILMTLLFYAGVVLKDGSLVIATTKNKKYTANQIYNKLKDSSGLSVALRLIDVDLIKKELGTKYDEEAQTAANEQAEQYLSMYASQGLDENSFLNSYGFKDRNEFINYIKDDYKLNKYYEQYLEKKVTDDEIQVYYAENVFEAKDIVIMSGTNDDLTKVKADLKKNVSIDSLKEKYTNVNINEVNDFTFDLVTAYSTTLVETVKNTTKGKSSDVISDNEVGTYIIYVKEVKENPTLENTKDNIKGYLATTKAGDQNEYYKVFIELRDKYKIKFKDASLKQQYETYKKQYIQTAEE